MTKYDSLIFCAAGAFVSLPRPGREDAERLDALAIPLFDQLSVEGKRRVAAVLSECRSVIPEQLVQTLILQPLDISASLLISRAEIPDAMLEKAIEKGGEPYTRVISLKHNISAAMKKRIDDFIESIVPMTEARAAEQPKIAKTELELAQDRLRNMMMRQTLPKTFATSSAFEVGNEPNIVARFINLALEGDTDLLCTALADEWSAPFALMRPLVKRAELHTLSVLLKGLDFGATDTFAIVSAFNPMAFNSGNAVAGFYLKYQAIQEAEIHNLKQRFLAETALPKISAGRVA